MGSETFGGSAIRAIFAAGLMALFLLDATAQNLVQVEKLRDIAALSYKEGASNLFELIDAQRTGLPGGKFQPCRRATFLSGYKPRAQLKQRASGIFGDCIIKPGERKLIWLGGSSSARQLENPPLSRNQQPNTEKGE